MQNAPAGKATALTQINVPDRIGPVVFGTLGGWITVRCPQDHAPLMRDAGPAGGAGPRLRLKSERPGEPTPPASH